jgi:hypothetical protein
MSHDQNFKNLVLDYPHAAIAFFAPAEAGSMDADVRITPVREEQLKERLGERFRELDIPLLLEWPDGRRAALVLVVEQQTAGRKFSALRLAHYCLDIADLLDTRRVVPVVIFLRDQPREYRLTLAGDDATYLDFHYISAELARMPYRQHRDSDNIVARVNLPNMAHDDSERVQVFADAIRGLFTLEQDPDKRLKYADFIDYYAMLDDAERQRYAAEHPTEATQMKTIFQQAREEGIQQGVQQGVQQGIQQGEARALVRFLERRFGTLPEHVRQRISTADEDTLDRWVDQAATAEHVEDALH